MTSLQKCKTAKLQRHEKGCEILTTKASRIKTSDKNGQNICPFSSWIRFLNLLPPHFMCGLKVPHLSVSVRNFVLCGCALTNKVVYEFCLLDFEE